MPAPALSIWLVLTPDGSWRPGIGDPSLMGWLTVGAYLAAAWLCLRAYRSARARGPAARSLALGWAFLCAGMALLGINKQLDLQSLITVIGRKVALEQGWYERRHIVQVWFIGGLGVVASGGALGLGLLLRRHLREFWLALLGGCFIALFVFVRATSFHSVDVFLRTPLAGVRANWLLELGGITCVALAALRNGRR